MKTRAPMSKRNATSLSEGVALVALLLATGCVPQAQLAQPGSSGSNGPQVPPAQSTPGAAPSPPNPAPAAPAAAAAPPAAPAAAPPTPPPLPPVVSFEQAVANAVQKVFTTAPSPGEATAALVIDPLVDGMSGYQSKATRTMQDQIVGIVRRNFPQYAVLRLSPDTLKEHPRILVGTFTAVNAQMKTAGTREAFRFCLVMGDLTTEKILAKSVAQARLEDVDATPTAVFADAPVWTDDPSVQAYVATCQASKQGDPIRPEYVDGLVAAALISEASDAYDEGRYEEALDLYTTARKAPAGDQLRVYNGLYVTYVKLRRNEEAATAFRERVDYGIRHKRLAVKFLFRPGSVRFATASNPFSASYGMWLQQIATVAATSSACLQITGHTSPTGPAALNDSLSLTRAEYIQTRLEEDEPRLKKRTVAAGVGSRENLSGTGRDDASDMLDRRVEIKPIEPCT